MAFQTGLFWLHTGGGLEDQDADYYGAAGTVKTKAAIDADVAADNIAIVDTGGAHAIFVKPLLVAAESGSDSDPANLEIYGAMGFGEPTQTDFRDKDKLIYKLGTVTAATVSSGTVGAVSTVGVFTTPGGTTFSSHTGGGTGVDVSNDIFATLASMAATTQPDVVDSDLANVDVGCGIFPGIQVFSQIIFSFDEGALATTSKANALINLYY